jgi:hypothetical protein
VGETKEDTLPTHPLLTLTRILTITVTYTLILILTCILTITLTFTLTVALTITHILTRFATFCPCDYLSVQRFVRAMNFLQPFVRIVPLKINLNLTHATQ